MQEKRFVRFWGGLVFGLLGCLVVCGIFPSMAHAITVSGSLVTNTRWGKAQSPVILTGDLTVESNVTLTIEAGVVVQAKNNQDSQVSGTDTSRVELIVKGTLVVDGTAAEATKFSCELNNTVNCWYGIRLQTGGKATLKYADIRDAYYGVFTEGGTADISNSHLHHNYVGYRSKSGTTLLKYSLFYRNQQQGLDIYAPTGVSATLDHLTIANNGSYGIYVTRSGGQATIQDSILAQNTNSGSPYQIYASGTGFQTCINNLIWSSRSTSTLSSQTCTSTVVGNPLFVDEATDDYHLTATSPARQKATDGTDLGAYSFAPTLAQILVLPNTASLDPGKTQQFTAEAYDSNGGQIMGLSFTWKVVNGGGTINASGLFTAGATVGTYNNTIEASSGSIKGYATITVNGPTIASVVITPSTITLQPAGQQLFVAAAYDSNNQRISGVSFSWSLVNGGGTLTQSGGLHTQATFVAGSTEGNFTIQATSATGNVTGTATAIVKKAAILAKITLAPATTTLKVGGKITFTATGEDTNGQPIATGTLAWSASVGTITQAGEYTAPNTAGLATITAESGAIKGTATVQISQGQAPTAPTLQSPASGASVGSLTPALVLVNSTDADGDKLTYTFEVASDSAFAQKVGSQNNVAETSGTTQWTVAPALQENKTYYWRAKASDGTLESPWSAVYSFSVNAKNDPPTAPKLSYPVDGGQVAEQQPSLEVTNASDPEGSVLTYRFEVATDAAFQQIATRSPAINGGTNGTTTWKVDVQLADGKKYYWRAKATDKEGLDGPWMTTATFTVSLANKAPSAPQARKPKDGDTVTTNKPDFEVINAVDPESDPVTLDIEVDTVKTFDSNDKIVQEKLAQDGSGITTWTSTKELQENTSYFWRVRASDGKATTPWVFGGEFFVNSQNDPPTAPTLKSPANGDTQPTIQVKLLAQESSDPDKDPLKYHLQASLQQDFLSDVIEDNQLQANNGEIAWSPAGLQAGKTYYWRARAHDGKVEGPWSEVWSFTIQAQASEETVAEPVAESVVEATPEAGSPEEPAVEASGKESQNKETGQGGEGSPEGKGTGGCGCQGNSPMGPTFGGILLLLLVVLRRRREVASKIRA
ncbi:MAG: right-handed parallel beta-helix repeat-containing protein [Myxococcales bacterium]|nr:right-handed parallel beta-helix repeat-containing protein [Myxococcales bacterium]